MEKSAFTETPPSEEGIEIPTGIQEKALLRKLDLKLLPALTLLYLLSFLDRSNVANARLEGLTTDLNMTGNQYLTGLTLYFIGYVLFEIPCNIVLKKSSPRKWLPTLTLAWGIVATLMGVTQNIAGFFAVPSRCVWWHPCLCMVSPPYFSQREKADKSPQGIAFMKGVGGLNGWRWIFILEGLLTILVSIAAYAFIANYPATASFLTPKERAYVHARLTADNDATRTEAFSWPNVRFAFADPKCWLYRLGFHTLSLPLYTLSLFLPTIIKNLGYTAAQAQLLTVPPYAAATCMTITVAVLSERYRLRAPFIMGSSCLAIIGYIILLSAPSAGVSYLGTILAACGIYPATAIVLSWPANNVSGQTKRATANAMQISIGNLGAVLGTQLYRSNDGPRFFIGHGFAAGYLAANVIVVGILWVVLRRENKRRDGLKTGEGGRVVGLGKGEWKGGEDLRWRFQT